MASNKDQNQIIPGAIQALLDQRTTFQDWLAKLDGVVSDFRPEVAEKVRKDYEDRLTGVEAELGTHSKELEGAVVARVARLDELAAEHDSRSADLEEAQLRHEVGEYTQSDWEEKRVEHASQLDTLSDEIGAERVAVTELEGVLAQVTGKQPQSAVLHVLPDQDGDGSDDESLDEDTADSTDEAEEETKASSEDLTEDDADSDMDLALVAEIVPAEADADAASAGAESEDGAFLDELEFLESLSMDETPNFDAVSQLLEEEEAGTEKGKKDA